MCFLARVHQTSKFPLQMRHKGNKIQVYFYRICISLFWSKSRQSLINQNGYSCTDVRMCYSKRQVKHRNHAVRLRWQGAEVFRSDLHSVRWPSEGGAASPVSPVCDFRLSEVASSGFLSSAGGLGESLNECCRHLLFPSTRDA